MKSLIILAVLFLMACTKENQGLHASLSISQDSGMWTLNPNGSTGPISTWEVKMYFEPGSQEAQAYGPYQLWGPNIWNPSTNVFGTNAGIYSRAVLIVKDAQGHADSVTVNQNY